MDENLLRSARDIDRVTSDRSKVEELYSAAKSAPTRNDELNRDIANVDGIKMENAVVAGRTLDLSGELSCNHYECLQSEVDHVFGRFWHYFDAIILEGLRPRVFVEDYKSDPAYAAELARSHLRAVQYLRDSGAEDAVIFREKPSPCTVHFKQHMEEARLDRIASESTEIISRLAKEGKVVELRKHKDHWHYRFCHPAFLTAFETGTVYNLPKKRSKGDVRKAVAKSVFRRHASHLVSDVRASREVGAPLGARVIDSIQGISRIQDQIHVDDVALEIDIPVLRSMRAGDIVKLREDEYHVFTRFRDSLCLAIKERLAADSSGDPEKMGRDIVDEVIQPSLNDIQQRLLKAQEILAKKSAIATVLGSIVISVGMLSQIPLVIPAGIAASLVSPTVHIPKYFEDKRDIELSDMYFLWLAERRAPIH